MAQYQTLMSAFRLAKSGSEESLAAEAVLEEYNLQEDDLQDVIQDLPVLAEDPVCLSLYQNLLSRFLKNSNERKMQVAFISAIDNQSKKLKLKTVKVATANCLNQVLINHPSEQGEAPKETFLSTVIASYDRQSTMALLQIAGLDVTVHDNRALKCALKQHNFEVADMLHRQGAVVLYQEALALIKETIDPSTKQSIDECDEAIDAYLAAKYSPNLKLKEETKARLVRVFDDELESSGKNLVKIASKLSTQDLKEIGKDIIKLMGEEAFIITYAEQEEDAIKMKLMAMCVNLDDHQKTNIAKHYIFGKHDSFSGDRSDNAKVAFQSRRHLAAGGILSSKVIKAYLISKIYNPNQDENILDEIIHENTALRTVKVTLEKTMEQLGQSSFCQNDVDALLKQYDIDELFKIAYLGMYENAISVILERRPPQAFDIILETPQCLSIETVEKMGGLKIPFKSDAQKVNQRAFLYNIYVQEKRKQNPGLGGLSRNRRFNEVPALVALLINQESVDINEFNVVIDKMCDIKSRATLLSQAVSDQNVSLVRCLMERSDLDVNRDYDPNEPNAMGVPINWALRTFQYQVINLLVEKNAQMGPESIDDYLSDEDDNFEYLVTLNMMLKHSTYVDNERISNIKSNMLKQIAGRLDLHELKDMLMMALSRSDSETQVFADTITELFQLLPPDKSKRFYDYVNKSALQTAESIYVKLLNGMSNSYTSEKILVIMYSDLIASINSADESQQKVIFQYFDTLSPQIKNLIYTHLVLKTDADLIVQFIEASGSVDPKVVETVTYFRSIKDVNQKSCLDKLLDSKLDIWIGLKIIDEKLDQSGKQYLKEEILPKHKGFPLLQAAIDEEKIDLFKLILPSYQSVNTPYQDTDLFPYQRGLTPLMAILKYSGPKKLHFVQAIASTVPDLNLDIVQEGIEKRHEVLHFLFAQRHSPMTDDCAYVLIRCASKSAMASDFSLIVSALKNDNVKSILLLHDLGCRVPPDILKRMPGYIGTAINRNALDLLKCYATIGLQLSNDDIKSLVRFQDFHVLRSFGIEPAPYIYAHQHGSIDIIQDRVQEDSLFVNSQSFHAAATVVHQHYLSKPYQNGSSSHRWANQRTLIELNNGMIISVDPKYITGCEKAMQFSDKNPDLPVQLDALAAEEGCNPFNLGRINVEAIEKDFYPYRVENVIHRFNHDIKHSIRVAAYIPIIYALIGTDEDRDDVHTVLEENQVEMLQLMMLFSVLGREDETGFSDAANKYCNNYYKSYRAVDALLFIQYCLVHWDSHYRKVFSNDIDKLYQAALVIEIMGSPKWPNPDMREIPLFTEILMKGASDESLTELKALIGDQFRFNQYLASLDDTKLKSLFPSAPVKESHLIPVYLNYMNLAHGIDLLRCYKMGNPGSLANKGEYRGAFLSLMLNTTRKHMIAGITKDCLISKRIICFYQMIDKIYNIHGERRATQIEKSEKTIQDLLSTAQELESLFMQQEKYPVPYNSIVDTPLSANGALRKQTMTLGDLVEKLVWDDSTLVHCGLKPGLSIKHSVIPEILGRYIYTILFLNSGSPHQSIYFNYSNYYPQSVLGKRALVHDSEMHRNFNEDVARIIFSLNTVNRPEFCESIGYPSMDYGFEAQQKTYIESQCGNGVLVRRTAKRVFVYFETEEMAKNVLSALHLLQIQFKATIHLTFPDTYYLELILADYYKIQPYLKFKVLQVPKLYSREDSLVTPQGQFEVLSLIKEIMAVTCLHNTVTSPGNGSSGLAFYMMQIQDPVRNRPVKYKLASPQREEIKNLLSPDFPIHRRQVRGQRLPLHKQEPMNMNPTYEDYINSSGEYQPRPVRLIQGDPNNTIFTKKSSHTLLSPFGNQLLYQGVMRSSYFPIGIISDVGQCHLHGQRYIWLTNVVSNQKFWLGPAMDPTQHPLRKSMGLHDLRDELTRTALSPRQEVHWNELLIGNTKTAIRGLLCPGYAGTQNRAPLSYRLNLFTQAMVLKADNGLDVPLVIFEGGVIPQIYTENDIKRDVHHAIEALLADKYPYLMNNSYEPIALNRKLICFEQLVLYQLFQKMAGQPIDEELHLFDHSVLPDDASILIQQNTLILKNYILKCRLDSPEIRTQCVENFGLIGSLSREKARTESLLAKMMPSNTAGFAQLIARQVRLNHVSLVEHIFEHMQSLDIKIDLNAIQGLNEPLLNVAFMHQSIDLIQFLLKHGADPSVPDNIGSSLFTLVEGLEELKNPTNQPYIDGVREAIERYAPDNLMSVTKTLTLQKESEAKSSVGSSSKAKVSHEAKPPRGPS